MTPALDWGCRLSDRIRAALDAGNLAAARRLAVLVRERDVLAGDGETPSLEGEYAAVYRELGGTARTLFRLLGEMDGRRGTRRRQPGANVLVHRFHADLAALHEHAADGVQRAFEPLRDDGHHAPDDVDAEVARAVRALEIADACFAREQRRLAREIMRALHARDVRRARQLLTAKEYDHYVPVHDRLVRFIAETFSWVLTHFGRDELVRVHRATAEAHRDAFERRERMTPAELARATACLAKQHMGRVNVEEDAEKFTIEQAPCGSGGRLRLMGSYAGPTALPYVSGPGPLALGESRLPVYCTQCAVWDGVVTPEWFGRTHRVVKRPARRDGSCMVYVYKSRNGKSGNGAPAEVGAP